MNLTRPGQQAAAGYELRFESLHREGYSLSFPCDLSGRVQLDGMSEPARTNYFFARMVVGRDFGMPRVRAVGAALH